MTISNMMMMTVLPAFLLGGLTLGTVPAKNCRPQMDMTSDRGVKIEALSMSHISTELATTASLMGGTNFQLTFQFKTKGKNGILFYMTTTQPRQLFSLNMNKANLWYKARCNNVAADNLLPTRQAKKTFNDGQWHNISFTIVGDKSQNVLIEVDGFQDPSSKTMFLTCPPINKLVMGGYSQADVNNIAGLENVRAHFRGCIRNVYMSWPTAGRTRYHFVSSCD